MSDPFIWRIVSTLVSREARHFSGPGVVAGAERNAKLRLINTPPLAFPANMNCYSLNG